MLLFSYGRSAQAQPDACSGVGGTTVTCSGDQSQGIRNGPAAPPADFTPPTTTLNVNNLNQDIAPALGVVGISFANFGAGDTIINSDTGAFRIITQGTYAHGIAATTGFNSIAVTHTGDIITQGTSASGIVASPFAGVSDLVAVTQTGNITTHGDKAFGIRASSASDVTVTQTGNISTRGNSADGIYAASYSFAVSSGAVTVTQTGKISTQGDNANGISARSVSGLSSTSGPVTVTHTGDISTQGVGAHGISAYALSAVSVTHIGNITANGSRAYGIFARTYAANGTIVIHNSGSAKGLGTNGIGISAVSSGANSKTVIHNSGSAYGHTIGIAAVSSGGNSKNLIYNSGDIAAKSLGAIYGNDTEIFNSGTITGFVGLYGHNRFINQAGGIFEARLTSSFGGGNDLFRNEAGATVHAMGDTRFVNLERFDNAGLISLQDDKTGDSLTISNTPGGTDLKFDAGSGSRLAVDAHLGGPGSRADTFTIEGDVSGTTTVSVVNTNYGPGTFNLEGIRVVTVTGATPNENAFQLDESIDTGFFDYDLFFTPTGSGFWELRSFAGPGAYLLPQLVTAAQDIWHQTSSTWFDRTADLRVLLAGGAAPTAYDPGGKDFSASGPYPLTPAVWARGSGSWLDRDGTARTTAYGRDYSFNMDRELDTLEFQVGVDMGKRDFFSQGDALVFGLLGGFVHGDLDYDALARSFNFDGGQVGAYATYLNGGLFVDTLLNVHLYSLDTNTQGFPDSLDANTVGLRTDTGYRFGSFSGGPFIEPLATIEVTWADIDGFSLGGNTVSFDDDANVRGRLGLRAGTTTQAWEGTLMEPFVIGSLWGNLTDDNSATLVSSGRTFRFEDPIDDVWGEVSAGVNFFNLTQTTAVFAKVDVTFGDDLTGLGGKAGMRVNW